ncbi:SDR family oxidoreductase [Aeoliella sp. SH292]|uniref:SDR family oxidoreductase n=1 Tax=Aeoliella sp. SH292 TaxID=3454464 RepID=UPI003F97A2DC
MPQSLLLFGCGYLGERVAKISSEQGDTVHAVTRSNANADEFRTRGWQPIVADVTDPASLTNLPTVDTVLIAVGYDRNSGKSIDKVYVDGVKNILAALPDDIGRLIYISTTGVYGNADGEWIDEDTPPCPTRPGGIASLAAEQLIRESQFADRAILLRLAGIYGPHRLPYLAQLKAGEPIEAPQEGYLNLIHVYDGARIVVALAAPARQVRGPVTYCVSDGHPVVRGEYYREVARQLGTPEPTFTEPEEGSPRAARAAADKRVSNRRLMADLPIELSCEDYKQGIAKTIQWESPS